MAARMGMLLDVSKCMGCRGCQVACKQWNLLPAVKTHFTGTYQNPPTLSGNTWTLIQFIEPEEGPVRWLFRKQQCLHCGDPSCLSVCPTGAISKRPNGIVYIDQEVCAGCKYCVEACPFDIPHPHPKTGTAKKCWLCMDRVENGLIPACAKVCPTDAIVYGTRDKVLQIAKERQQLLAKANPNSTPRIYGETELGGLGVMYLLPETAATYGLPEKPKKPTAGIIFKWLLGLIPGAALLYGMRRYLEDGSGPADDSGEAAPETKEPAGTAS